MRSKSSISRNSTHPTPQQDGTSSRTRSRTKSRDNNPHTPTTPATANGMSHLLSLFSALRSGKSKTTPTTIYEDNISDGISILPDDASSTQHPQTLTTNPTYQLSDQSTTANSTQQSSQASPPVKCQQLSHSSC